MSIPLPPLDDRTYADLREEALALIPSLAPDWTNHNPSDPGITLIELFAWLTEMLIYRINRLPEANTLAFLRLLNGPEWKEGEDGKDLQEDIRTTVLDLRRRHRAVTTEDYEALAREASPGVARARCVPLRDLSGTTEARRLALREGYVSLVIVPNPEVKGSLDPASSPGAPLPAADLLSEVSASLEPRRLIAVRQIVVPPIYVPIQAEIVVATRPDVPVGPLRTRLVEALQRHLDPILGGPEREGWPFGRDVYVSELYRLLEKDVQGVDYVPQITLSSACLERAPRCVAGSELWHDEGDQIGIALSAHHLPWAQIDPAHIVIGLAFLELRVEVAAAAQGDLGPAAARRAVKTAVKLLFHPLHGGPGGPTSWEITTDEITAALAKIAKDANVHLVADPTRLFPSGKGNGVRFEAGELADVTVTVEIRND
jgi:hypothetical protein